MPAQTVIQVRRSTASTWTSTNPTLAAGEFGLETDTLKVKIGNGSTAWASLGYLGGAGGVTVSASPPSSPESGALWFDSDTAQTYVYYDSSWVEIVGSSVGARVNVSSGVPSSPLEGSMWFDSDTAQTFVYYDGSWVEIGASGMAAIVAESSPVSPIDGQIWFNSASGGAYVYYGSASAWVELGAAPFDQLLSKIDAKGDLLVGTADNTVARQAVGTNGQILVANSSASAGIEWQTPNYASTGKSIAMAIVFGS